MISVTSASRYVTSASHYESRSLMYIRGLIQGNSTELAEAVPIEVIHAGLYSMHVPIVPVLVESWSVQVNSEPW